MNQIILTEKEAAKYINMSCSFLRQDRMNGHLKLGRSIRYRKDDLDAWLSENCINRTA